MSVVVCSLLWSAERSGAQRITYDPDGYHLVRFPYEESEESYDPWKMHDPAQGGSTASEFPDLRSGLIRPSHDGWGVLSAMVFRQADTRAHEYRARFVRDPLGASTGYDSTATDDTVVTGAASTAPVRGRCSCTRGRPWGRRSRRAAEGTRRSPSR
ncbi:hypothetical protein GCM10010358_56280 [Streptomyces minutiscleroticus]|uniref:Uncharacterized protein n=1 Tax=Streptomyces minutiscleroticus TaxID=68238 RepID=A0A918NTM3_9ACTN|nr:hypothetical protein GCM10010358_56280 [Streptomyces minutiscleroticus]